MLSKEQKRKIVVSVAEILKTQENIIFADFSGITMAEITELKRELKKRKIGWMVMKKSLLDFAFKEAGREAFNFSDHKGSMAISYGSDAAGAAKIIHKFFLAHKKPIILGGFLMGEKMPKDRVVMLAQLPAREVLLAQILQLFMSPVSGFVRALDGISKKVAGKNLEAGI